MFLGNKKFIPSGIEKLPYRITILIVYGKKSYLKPMTTTHSLYVRISLNS